MGVDGVLWDLMGFGFGFGFYGFGFLWGLGLGLGLWDTGVLVEVG